MRRSTMRRSGVRRSVRVRVMAVAVAKVTWKNGLTGPQGFGFPLALAAMAFTLIFFGAGPISLDHAIFGGGKKGPSK